jgi:hypothetical protein
MDDPIKMLELLSELHTHPGLDMSAVTGRYTRPDAMFAEVNDEGDPPAFAETSHRDFPLDFETVLGFYDADERRPAPDNRQPKKPAKRRAKFARNSSEA